MDELKNQEFTNFKGAKKVVSRVRLILEEKKDIPLEIEKGKTYWWKLFGIIPLVKYTAKKNLYRPYKDFCCRTFEGMVYTDFFNNSRVYKFDYDKEEIFKKARVEIEAWGSEGVETKFFESNEEAKEFYDNIVCSLKN